MLRAIKTILSAGLLLLGLCGTAHATFHTFVINELYTNADGTVQYVELHENQGQNGQNLLGGHTLTSSSGGVVNTFTFPNNLASPFTANHFVLIATQGFANLGIVTPDYIIPAGFLFSAGGTVNYAGVSTVVHGALPTDGVHALRADGSVVVNGPTNFAGFSGSITVSQFVLSVSKAGSGSGTVTSSPAGINCGSICSTSVASGTMLTLTATPAAGSTFAGWIGACSGTSTCVVSVSAATTVTATFTVQQFALTVSTTGAGTVTSNPAGINCGSACAVTVNSGSTLTLTAVPTSGSIFSGWSGACTGAFTCSVTVSAATAVSARFAPFAASTNIDIRTYVPAAAASSGYTSYLRAINTGSIASPIVVYRIDPVTGLVGSAGTLNLSLPPGASATYAAAQVESALGITIDAAERPRIRMSASGTTIATQSFLLQPGGAFNEISAAQSGPSVSVATYVPAAAAPSGYTSYLRVINTGAAAAAVTVAMIDPSTGQVGAASVLNGSLAAGAAVIYAASQVEATLGVTIAAAQRPRLVVAAVGTTLDVQSFLIQPGGAFTDVSSSQSGSMVDVRSYVPNGTPGYTSYLRVINGNASATPVTVAVVDDRTGAVGASATLIGSLAGMAAATLTSSQIESALGVTFAAGDRPRIRISCASGTLTVQSFLLQPGGAFNEISGAASGSTVMVRTYIPAADAVNGYTSYLRVINTGASATPVTVALVDAATGTVGNAGTLIASLPAGGAQTFNSGQVETALGMTIAAGTRPQIQVSATTVLEVQSFLIQPGGAFTEVSSGQ